MMDIKERVLSNDQTVYYRSATELKLLLREFYQEHFYDGYDIELADGDCVFDVGANIGFFLLKLNQSLRNGQVFCFEPIPETFELLRRNADRNNHLDLQLLPCGLADRAGTVEFTHRPRMSVASSMCPDDSSESRRNARRLVYRGMRKSSRIFGLASRLIPEPCWWPITEIIRRVYDRQVQVSCSLRTLSDVIDEFHVPKIDLVKIDVEGAEQLVLDGIREEHWPRIRQAMLEIHHGIEAADRIAGQLRERGFVVHIRRCWEHVDHLFLLFAKRPE